MIMGHGGAGQLYMSGGKATFRPTPGDQSIGGGPALFDGSWYHVVGTWDGHHAHLYVDGHEVASSNTNGVTSGSATFYVGYGEAVSQWWHGYIDEAVYYSSSL